MNTKRVYRNLHLDTLSVQHYIPKVGWRLERHQYGDMVLVDCTFKVSKAGRRRVLAERRKNVHAYVCGTEVPGRVTERDSYYGTVQLSYNPYKCGSFVVRSTGEPVSHADEVHMIGNTVWALNPS